MENRKVIVIGYVGEFQEKAISDFKNGLSKEIEVIQHYQDKKFSEGIVIYPLIISFSEWIFTESGKYVLNLLFEKMLKLILDNAKEYDNNPSIKIEYKNGEMSQSLIITNTNDSTSVNSALEVFRDIAINKQNP